MSEEFNTVTRKKWISYNSLTKRFGRNVDKSGGFDKEPEVDIDKFMM